MPPTDYRPPSTGYRLPSTGVLWRTLRPLRWSQLGYLALRRILWRGKSPAIWEAPVELRRLAASIWFAEWEPTAARHMLATREFTFLNRTVGGAQAIPWNDANLPKLWLFHLNYCDFLNVQFSLPADATALEAAIEIALDWKRCNTQGTEAGWEPYPIALRVVNWLKLLVRQAEEIRKRPSPPLSRPTPSRLGEEVPNALQIILHSIAQQTATLELRLEKDRLANHLLKNIKALLFAGALLETPASPRWWSTGARLLEHELDEQILPDGGHFERSPMYHAQVLEDLLEIQTLATATNQSLACADRLAHTTRKMADFLRGILHADGEIPFFNDAALGMARPAADLLAVTGADGRSAASDEPEVALFPETGYGVLRHRAWASSLVFDCGPLGPDYQPGHGHCDVLSYELALHGRRVIVNTGTSTYDRNGDRLYERSTAAHNTVRVDGEDQAEIWASFRVGRRPRVGKLEQGSSGPYHWLRGEHFGYQHRGVVHARLIAFRADGVWLVADLLKGRGTHRWESFIHLHPAVQVECRADLPSARVDGIRGATLRFTATSDGDKDPRRADNAALCVAYSLVANGAGEFELLDRWYAEEFGKRLSSKVLCWKQEGEIPVVISYVLAPEGVALPQVTGDPAGAAIEIDGLRLAFAT